MANMANMATLRVNHGRPTILRQDVPWCWCVEDASKVTVQELWLGKSDGSPTPWAVAYKWRLSLPWKHWYHQEKMVKWTSELKLMKESSTAFCSLRNSGLSSSQSHCSRGCCSQVPADIQVTKSWLGVAGGHRNGSSWTVRLISEL